MVVLTAVSAAAYVAVLLPFKVAVIIPGLTEVRPGAAVPILLSFLFGPAAAWGAAFGNVIGDLLGGMFGPGSIAGFFGNLFYGFWPYALWRAVRGHAAPGARGSSDWVLVGVIIVVSSVTIGAVIGWGADLLGLAPFGALGNVIAVNNAITGLVLAIPLIALIYPRVEKAGLLWFEVMDVESSTPRAAWRTALGILAPLAAFAAGNAIAFGFLDADFGAAGFGAAKGTAALGAGMAPFILALFAVAAAL